MPEEQMERWNGAAGRAWVEAQDITDRVFAPVQDVLVDAVMASSPRAVLDVGCGTGSTTVAVARRLEANGRATGVDISEAMLAAARARAERERVAATFIRADAQEHAFETAAFEAIMSRFGVMFFDDPVRAFTNLRRAAADGGALRLIVWRSPADNPFMTTAERAAAPLLPNLPPRDPDAPGQFAFASRDRVRAILESSGWSDVDVRPLDVECTLSERELERWVSRLGPVGVALADADDETRARVVGAVRPAFDPFVRDGAVRFNAACWMIDGRAGRD